MLDDSTILEIIGSELSNADPSTNGAGGASLENSLAYYLGLPNGTEVPGYSTVTSTDVADAIEWIMPQIMKSFTQNNEVVVFDQVDEHDEMAEVESKYVYDVLMKQNDGFIILHQFVKDALMQRNGILKVYYADEEIIQTKQYTGMTESQVYVLLSMDGVELVSKDKRIDFDAFAMTGDKIDVYDIEVRVTRKKGKIFVDSVPPEEFRINNHHNSLDASSARFTAHVFTTTLSELVKDGLVSKNQSLELPQGDFDFDNDYRFYLQDEDNQYDGEGYGDPSQRLVEVSECYLMIDMNQNGISTLWKITAAGGDTPTEILSKEEIDSMPWVTTTAILMSHKFQGLSITDRLMQIQDQKTALWRNIMTNMYLQNNQRMKVVEDKVNMEDLLISRPGSNIRVDDMDSIAPLVTPPIGKDAYAMMDYLDKVRSGRTGVDPDGPATPNNIGDRVGSEGVDRLMNAKEELVGLIIRVMAETGVKPLCVKIRNLLMSHIDAVDNYKYRGRWYQINPALWRDRNSTTVRVGTGTGDKTQQLNALSYIIDNQKSIGESPAELLVNEKRLYNALDDFCKMSGLVGAERYFVDPDSDEGIKEQEDIAERTRLAQEQEQKENDIILGAQSKIANAELGKAKAQLDNAVLRSENEKNKNIIDLQANEFDAQLQLLKQEIEELKLELNKATEAAKIELEYDKLATNVALELTKLEADKEGASETYEILEEKQDERQ